MKADLIVVTTVRKTGGGRRSYSSSVVRCHRDTPVKNFYSAAARCALLVKEEAEDSDPERDVKIASITFWVSSEPGFTLHSIRAEELQEYLSRQTTVSLCSNVREVL